ncbi:hypothetical protein Goshw_014324 [Gossypium schwendimanii]|uniref:Large ribosomal subunit protein uL24 C-terminal domain-containing protein n=1 Tax=Gossypium schwendimanii TaxID=34291 RepID=A0A7J9MXS5_GOSSC|nr:hypothetical protein [Gossypium schwendimanii]
MANKLVAVYILVSIVVVAATMWVSPVAAEGDDNESFKSCYKECEDECKEEGTSSEMCEVMIIKRVIRSQNRVIVEGKNLVKKHIKQGSGHEAGIFTVEAPFHASIVQVLDPVTGKPCKIGVKYLEDGTKVRVSRGIGASGSIIPRPEILKMRATPRPTVAGPKDTPMNLVLEKTHDPKSGKGMPEL